MCSITGPPCLCCPNNIASLEGSFTASHVVIRFLTPLGVAYDKAVERYRPDDRIVRPQPRMREGTVKLINLAGTDGKSAYVLVNNRAEGCVPQTIQAIVGLLAQGEAGHNRRPWADRGSRSGDLPGCDRALPVVA
jgi:hypothetical protein